MNELTPTKTLSMCCLWSMFCSSRFSIETSTKLHTDLPHVIRRGSSKDGEINEHINVLHNNTNANAPLPDGTCPAAALDNENQCLEPHF